VPILTSPSLTSAGFAHGFPTRDVSDEAVAAALGAGAIVRVSQVHGARAVFAADAAGQEADAVVAPGGAACAVGVRVADCVPVLVANVETGSVAAIHAGWRGVVAGVVAAGVTRLGRGPLVAAIGPCIGACCFEVGSDVGERIGFVTDTRDAKAFVDLRAAVRAQLAVLGVNPIDDVPGCTKHEPERFYSFRRDGPGGGRMLAAIASR
jgi:YfiH family protein